MARKKNTKQTAQGTRQNHSARRRARRHLNVFKHTTVERLFSTDILANIASKNPELEGLRDVDYECLPGERLGEKVNEAWSKLRRAWDVFDEYRQKLPEGDSGTSLTRKYWLLPMLRHLGFSQIVSARLEKDGVDVAGKRIAPTHVANEPVAFVLKTFRQDLDSRDLDERGAKGSPHSALQTYLNAKGGAAWGFLSNGLRFRIMRENRAMAQVAYVEFDLESIFSEDDYAEFYLFFLLVHASRYVKRHAERDESPLDDSDSDSDASESETPVVPEREDDSPWIEKWRAASVARGVRALDGLSPAFEVAIKTLGTGFFKENPSLQEKLRSGKISTKKYYEDLLLLAYRIVFLLIAEDRDLLFPYSEDEEAKRKKERYLRFYSASRIRTLARRRVLSRHADLWVQLRGTIRYFAKGESRLGIAGLGSSLFTKETIFDDARLLNDALLKAVGSLTSIERNNATLPVDYRNLGVEELGSVYEGLLELTPRFTHDRFEFVEDKEKGNMRKTTGAYYTPPELVEKLIETALVPTLEEKLSGLRTREERRRALLGLKVCDPSCGSGHFLVGAARKLAKRLAMIETGDVEPSVGEIRNALREVVVSCLYGVDLNPMAVELCKVALWIESMRPGKSLAFLDHRIRCGNSLLGATRDEVEGRIPDEAYSPLEGDDKEHCKELKERNRKEFAHPYFSDEFLEGTASQIALDFRKDFTEKRRRFDELPNETAEDYAERERAFRSSFFEYDELKTAADLWCGAFLLPKRKGCFGVTHEHLRRCEKTGSHFLAESVRTGLKKVSADAKLFHWDIEYPDVFMSRDRAPGFDVVLGTPPWERVKLQEKEWFAGRSEKIATAKNKAARQKEIEALKENDRELYESFREAVRKSETTSLFLRGSGIYPLCGKGDVNTYQVFAERDWRLLAPGGRAGFVVPSEIASGKTTEAFFRKLVNEDALESFFDFENRRGLFPDVDSRMKFALTTVRRVESGGSVGSKKGARFSFFNYSSSDLEDAERVFTLTRDDFALLNPNTRTSPIFRGVKDAELTKGIYRRVPILLREKTEDSPEENPWGISFSSMFHMANDSHLFRERATLEELGGELSGARFLLPDGKEYWPLYEAKMVHFYNSRFADYADLPEGSKSTQLPRVSVEKLKDPAFSTMPRYWVAKEEVLDRIPKGTSFLMCYRKITNTTNERTDIAGFTSMGGFGDSALAFFFLPESKRKELKAVCLYSMMTSFVWDYFVRQKLGGVNLLLFIKKQLPALPPSIIDEACPFDATQSVGEFVKPRVLELTYTSWDMKGFAECLGYEGAPFAWDEERRFRLRCELDALYFALYLGRDEWRRATVAEERPEDFAALTRYFPTPLDALDYIMGTFPIVKRKEEEDAALRGYARRLLASIGAPEDEERYPSFAAIRALFLRGIR